MIFGYGAITLYGVPFQGTSSNQISSNILPQEQSWNFIPRLLPTLSPCNPHSLLAQKNRFGLFPLRSPLLRE
jgi:hypothetical protein